MRDPQLLEALKAGQSVVIGFSIVTPKTLGDLRIAAGRYRGVLKVLRLKKADAK